MIDLINDWQSKCVSETECNFNLGKYMNSPNTGSGCYKDQNKIFIQFNCTMDDELLSRSKTVLNCNIGFTMMTVALFYVGYCYVWYWVRQQPKTHYKEYLNPALFTLKAEVGAEVWDRYKDRPNSINQLQDDLDTQLKEALRDTSECEIVSITTELKDKYPCINGLVKKRELLNELEAESKEDKKEAITIKLIDVDADLQGISREMYSPFYSIK